MEVTDLESAQAFLDAAFPSTVGRAMRELRRAGVAVDGDGKCAWLPAGEGRYVRCGLEIDPLAPCGIVLTPDAVAVRA